MNKIKPFVLSCMMLLAGPAWSELVAVSPSGFIIKNRFETTHSAEAIWAALVNDIDQWWPKDHSWWQGTFSIDAVAGGCFCELSDNRSAEHMRISFVEPHQRLLMTGGLGPLQGMGIYGALNWQIIPLVEGSEVTLTYQVHGYSPQGFEQLAPVVDKVQHQQLSALKHFLQSSTPAAPE
ncbi:SRPBCC domain-containing protein [Alteromonas aestuariivivens]|uniref:SRPBCC domain-containing protein n=1 Tax=Alteromonas aestuariivivens TaxID=1938339 RepID=A0A3D8M8J6_9ALTE|nr:SRPBCC domain-containing protein [Alteromonas aestuariivivens]RDV26119.1 SRPBCC domain-containing protein [Alteromonas aestuariivivens]